MPYALTEFGDAVFNGLDERGRRIFGERLTEHGARIFVLAVTPLLAASAYTVEVRDKTGDLLWIIPLVTGVEYTANKNQSPSLSFLMSFDSDIVSDLMRPNEVWLRRSDGDLIEKFRIALRMDTHDNN